MLAAPRTETVRETEKVFLVNLVEDGDHGLLDDFVFQRRDPQWTLPSICFLYVHSSRWFGPVCAAMNSAMQVSQPFFYPFSYSCQVTPSTPGAAFLFNE